MVQPHEYGAFSHRAHKNIFTLEDITHTPSRKTSPSPTRHAPTTIYQQEKIVVIHLQRVAVAAICALSALTSMLIAMSACTHPALIVALFLQILTLVVAAVYLIKHRKEFTSQRFS